MSTELPLPPTPEPEDPPSRAPAAFCRDCDRPVYSAAARRTGLGGGCRRKHRRASARRGGRFTVDQDPLPDPG